MLRLRRAAQVLKRVDQMSVQERNLIELLQSRYREDPNGFREYLPGVAELLPEMSPRQGRRKPPFGLSEAEIAFHRAGLADVLHKMETGSVTEREAIEALQHCAVLIVDDSLPEDVNYEKLKRLIITVIGRSPESFKSEATIQVGEGNGDVHERVSAIRGVYLDLDRDRRLVSVTINPRRVRDRHALMEFVGASKDPEPLASTRHDDYLASEDPHGTR